MTEEYKKDLRYLKDALDALQKIFPTNPLVKPFEDLIKEIEKDAGNASTEIGKLRESIQPKINPGGQPDHIGHLELGLWAAGLGCVPMKARQKLSDKIPRPSNPPSPPNQSEAEIAGKAVKKFFETLTQTFTQKTGQQEMLLKSLLDCVITEARNSTPPWDEDLLNGLKHILDKINNRLPGSFSLGDPDTDALTPKYYWPNTYVSSSSSSGAASSSSWPPP